MDMDTISMTLLKPFVQPVSFSSLVLFLLFLSLEPNMTVYIVVYRGTVYGVYDSREKATASEYGDLYDTEILEREVV